MPERVDTERLRALAEAATPGPWEIGLNGAVVPMPAVFESGGKFICEMWALEGLDAGANASFVAACSPDVLLALLAERDEWLRRIANLNSADALLVGSRTWTRSRAAGGAETEQP